MEAVVPSPSSTQEEELRLALQELSAAAESARVLLLKLAQLWDTRRP